jgi:hypothetical protein
MSLTMCAVAQMGPGLVSFAMCVYVCCSADESDPRFVCHVRVLPQRDTDTDTQR